MSFLISKDDIINESIVEGQLIGMELAGLDDESLVDEIMDISAKADLYVKIDKIISSFFRKGKLSKKEREELEYAYLLWHIDHCVEE
jgi:hypothetical protein